MECVKKAIETGQPLRQKSGQLLEVELPQAQSLMMNGDKNRVARAVEQLLDNAAKFCPSGTAIALQCKALGSDAFEVTVADQGPGVPEFARSRIFDPFYQADGSPTRAQGGTGVGLAVARGVARGHGGDLVLSPRALTMGGKTYQGACFVFTVKARGDSIAS